MIFEIYRNTNKPIFIDLLSHLWLIQYFLL